MQRSDPSRAYKVVEKCPEVRSPVFLIALVIALASVLGPWSKLRLLPIISSAPKPRKSHNSVEMDRILCGLTKDKTAVGRFNFADTLVGGFEGLP